jgi:anti-anti-sigma regulatory factor
VEKLSETEILLAVSGSLYGEVGAQFEERIESLCTTNYSTITLDLSMALGITSSAIGKLLSAHKRLLVQNRRIRICGCSEVLYSIFQKIRLDTLIQITR